MPCYDPRNEPAYILQESNEKIGRLTERLCEACGRLDALGQINTLSGDTQRWWKAHKAADERRQKEAEEKRKLRGIADRAIRKLSPEDIEALQFTGRMKK